MLGQLEGLDVRVDRGGALRRLPRVLGRLVRHVSEQVVVRERGQEIPDALAQDRFIRDRDAPVQLDPPADEQCVVRDLLHDRVLEAVPAFTPLTRRGLEDQIGRDQVIDRVRDPRSSGLTENAVAEALSDHRGELDRLLCRRRQPIDARGDDPVQGRRHLERCGPLAQLPFPFFVFSDGA